MAELQFEALGMYDVSAIIEEDVLKELDDELQTPLEVTMCCFSTEGELFFKAGLCYILLTDG